MRKNKFEALKKMADDRKKAAATAAGITIPEKTKGFGGDEESQDPAFKKLAKKIENLYGIAPSDIDR